MAHWAVAVQTPRASSHSHQLVRHQDRLRPCWCKKRGAQGVPGVSWRGLHKPLCQNKFLTPAGAMVPTASRRRLAPENCGDRDTSSPGEQISTTPILPGPPHYIAPMAPHCLGDSW